MVRSAGMYFTSEAVKYLPSIDDVAAFEPLARGQVGGGSSSNSNNHNNTEGGGGGDKQAVQGQSLSEDTIRAAANMDQARNHHALT
jgi:hypothetical protein